MCKIKFNKKIDILNEIKRHDKAFVNKFVKFNKDVFECVGKFEKKFIIRIKEDVTPVLKSGRRLPITI